jgi:GT2 family glycosyltransferase
LGPLLTVLGNDDVFVVLQESDDFDHQLHRMWNDGVDRCRAAGCNAVAILNDDIVMLPGTLSLMARALRSDPTLAVVGPDTTLRRQNGIPARVKVGVTPFNNCGYAFLFDPNDTDVPRFNEDFNIWHGDLEFFDTIRRAGRTVGTISGLAILHEGSHSVKKIMGQAATDIRTGLPLRQALAEEAKRGNEDARRLLADDAYARLAHGRAPAPPPGRRHSWEQARRELRSMGIKA